MKYYLGTSEVQWVESSAMVLGRSCMAVGKALWTITESQNIPSWKGLIMITDSFEEPVDAQAWMQEGGTKPYCSI